MRILTAAFILLFVLIFSFDVRADQMEKDKVVHEIHGMMRLMDNALCQVLEGANLQMFGQMGEAGRTDKDLIERGGNMIKEGRATISKIIAGTEMKAIHTEGDYDKKLMLNLHALGDRMLHVIEEVEKLHGKALQQMSGP